ncbi:MAG: hypothetical protein J6W96_02495 [Alphaproteobacteria bacterium]|nr:hypothetical protein [Alphaproteobacteria bacterium]
MSKIEIVNRALIKLGEPPISSLSDAAFGKTYEVIYEDIKNLLLASYPWRFAVALKRLAQCAEKFGECFMYRLPTDFLLLVKVFGAGNLSLVDVHLQALTGYEIVNQAIIVNHSDGVVIEYVQNVDDDDLFPALFREALAAKIAAELAMRLKHDLNIKQVFDNEFYNLIRQAELNNEIEKDAEILPDSSWVSVRENWSF